MLRRGRGTAIVTVVARPPRLGQPQLQAARRVSRVLEGGATGSLHRSFHEVGRARFRCPFHPKSRGSFVTLSLLKTFTALSRRRGTNDAVEIHHLRASRASRRQLGDALLKSRSSVLCPLLRKLGNWCQLNGRAEHSGAFANRRAGSRCTRSRRGATPQIARRERTR